MCHNKKVCHPRFLPKIPLVRIPSTETFLDRIRSLSKFFPLPLPLKSSAVSMTSSGTSFQKMPSWASQLWPRPGVCPWTNLGSAQGFQWIRIHCKMLHLPDLIAPSCIGNIVVPVFVVGDRTRPFAQSPSLHLLFNVPIFLWWSVHGRVCGVCNLPEGQCDTWVQLPCLLPHGLSQFLCHCVWIFDSVLKVTRTTTIPSGLRKAHQCHNFFPWEFRFPSERQRVLLPLRGLTVTQYRFSVDPHASRKSPLHSTLNLVHHCHSVGEHGLR